MIQNYNPDSVYQVFEINEHNKKFKIGEIENFVFFDVSKKGKRIEPGFKFTNSPSFWSQFKNITIKEISRPLDGFEPIVWGIYWTIQFFITVGLVVIADGLHNQIFWIATSAIHYAFTIKFRNNKYVIYWMAIASIVVIVLLFTARSKKKI